MVDKELAKGYTNAERLYIILVWPVFLIGLINEIVKGGKQN